MYDPNGNQKKRVVDGQTLALEYDAENRLVKVCQDASNNAVCDSGETVIATFVYDGDGRRVKSVIGSETILFIGGHYEIKNPGSGQEVTKYYFAGASRIAMRKYTIPQSMAVEYLLGDHLGSTSITTDANGAKVSELRYKPWGEARYSWTAGASTTPAYMLNNYTFTGQFSYMDDPSTSGVTEGFGLMFYNARMYDPVTGRFTSADTIIPGGVQGLDRYAYVNNSPLNYIDPTGHNCEPGDTEPGGYCWSPHPDKLDPAMLKKTAHGMEVYEFYKRLYTDKKGWWWTTYGADGHFSAWDFIGMMYGYELGIIATNGTYKAEVYPDYTEAMVRNSRQYCKELKGGCDPSSAVGAFMHLSFYSQSTQKRAQDATPDMYMLDANRISGGMDLAAAIQNPAAFGHPEWNDGFVNDRPYSVGNGSLFTYSPRSWLWKIGGDNDDDPAYVLTGCQFLDAKGYTDLFYAWGCTFP